MAFAKLTGQPLAQVLHWHPRDVDTWLDMLNSEASAQRQAEATAEVQRAMGGG